MVWKKSLASPGFEPETFSVLDWRDNQLHHDTTFVALAGIKSFLGVIPTQFSLEIYIIIELSSLLKKKKVYIMLSQKKIRVYYASFFFTINYAFLSSININSIRLSYIRRAKILFFWKSSTNHLHWTVWTKWTGSKK